ncbi:hypothetical protein ACHAXR_005524 [Thalassiosira sp. AJA248-18]
MSSQDPPITLPPPPPPSPYYTSSSSSSSQNNNNTKYDERDYESIYYHFDDYSQEIILANASKFLTPPEPAEHYEWEEVILDEASQGEWEGMKKSLCFGLGCSLVSFGMLRWRRRRGGGGGGSMMSGLSKYASSSSSSSSSRSRSTGGYTFDPVPPKSSNAIHQQHHHYHHHGRNGYNSNNNTRSGFVIDMTLSTLIGIGTSLLAIESDVFFYPTAITNSSDDNNINSSSTSNTTTTTNNNIIIEPPPQWISPQIPLVPGRSIISDTLCGPLTEEFRKFPKQLWQSSSSRNNNGYNNHMALYANSGWKGTKYYTDNPNAMVVSLGENDDVDGIGGGSTTNDQYHSTTKPTTTTNGVYEHLLLDSLQAFIINCERRSRHERKLRRQIRGIQKGRGGVLPLQSMVIPDGGVSCDEDLELDDIYLVEMDDGGDDDDGDTGFGL